MASSLSNTILPSSRPYRQSLKNNETNSNWSVDSKIFYSQKNTKKNDETNVIQKKNNETNMIQKNTEKNDENTCDEEIKNLSRKILPMKIHLVS